ncbi:MAG: hypothetical protein IIZ78_04010, partial [Clostridiales bacterium]|nr:hypothetical protein [Clostridiales bacterium]
MLECFALGLLRFPLGLSGLLSLIDFFMLLMLKAVAALNFGACLGLLLWLCLLCFGWVGLCLGALALALCGALPAALVIPLAALRAALFDWRVPALALPALPWVGFALPWVGFALALPALPWVGFALPWVGFALPWVGFALALPALPLALPALPWMGLCFALGGVLGAWGVWCWVLGVLGAWGVGCWVLGVWGVGVWGVALAPAPWGRLSFLRFALQT